MVRRGQYGRSCLRDPVDASPDVGERNGRGVQLTRAHAVYGAKYCRLLSVYAEAVCAAGDLCTTYHSWISRTYFFES